MEEMRFQHVEEQSLSAELTQLVDLCSQLYLTSVLIGSASVLIGQCLPEQLVNVLHNIPVS